MSSQRFVCTTCFCVVFSVHHNDSASSDCVSVLGMYGRFVCFSSIDLCPPTPNYSIRAANDMGFCDQISPFGFPWAQTGTPSRCPTFVFYLVSELFLAVFAPLDWLRFSVTGFPAVLICPWQHSVQHTHKQISISLMPNLRRATYVKHRQQTVHAQLHSELCAPAEFLLMHFTSKTSVNRSPILPLYYTRLIMICQPWAKQICSRIRPKNYANIWRKPYLRKWCRKWPLGGWGHTWVLVAAWGWPPYPLLPVSCFLLCQL